MKILPHQAKYKDLLKLITISFYVETQMNEMRSIDNAMSRYMGNIGLLFSPQQLVSSLEEDGVFDALIKDRIGAKKKLNHNRHQLAVSLHIAEKSSYIKARNRNKNIRKKSK